ncbi:MAG: penicillin-binding transpeptidase domain-containing protein, partial [Niameybacter sp.]
DMVGIETAFNYLLNFGFTTLKESDKVYALPLGGLTEGVTPLELNAAYAAIANQGTYTKPVLYTQVLSRDKEVLLDNTVPESHAVIKTSTASMLTDMMEDVVS